MMRYVRKRYDLDKLREETYTCVAKNSAIQRRREEAQTRMNIHLIGVPLEMGAGKRGTGLGPAAIRYAGMSLLHV